ncbi:MAG: antibiotic biosynthesis monooxygenase family protein [Gaiella sp.]
MAESPGPTPDGAGATPVYTTGSWQPFAGAEDAFVEAWQVFADWAATLPGARDGLLVRDLRAPERFLSFVGWESMDAVRAWKTHPEFKERMARVQAHVDRFAPTETEVVRRVTAG